LNNLLIFGSIGDIFLYAGGQTQKIKIIASSAGSVKLQSTKKRLPTCGRNEHELVNDSVRAEIFFGPELRKPAA
jgi:hypothetical protein